jgi:hypothetical protein
MSHTVSVLSLTGHNPLSGPDILNINVLYKSKLVLLLQIINKLEKKQENREITTY